MAKNSTKKEAAAAPVVAKPASSLSSLFGSTSSNVDESVSALFSSGAGPIKRVIKERTVVKIPKRAGEKSTESSEKRAEKIPESVTSKDEDGDEEMEEASPSKKQKSKSKSKKPKDDEENFDLESKYYEKVLKDESKPETKEEPKTESTEDKPELENFSDSDSEDEDKDTEAPVKGKAAKPLDLKEIELNKAESTVFVGNVLSKVITEKKSYKAFKQLFATFGKIESIRFRSISFNEALPRKVAFVQHKFHDSRDTVNAYIVFAKKEDSKKALELNATIFADNHIRVDHVAHPAKQDNQRSIFVGNLDFDEKEESLWKYFETTGKIEYVRIIRDSKTNVGKGFAYVQFSDFLGVTKALLLNDKPLTTSEKKRKLRISRCKNMKPTASKDTRGGQHGGQRVNLSDQQKTKLGRAKKILGKADRSTAGKVIVEGNRASKGQRVTGIKNGLGKIKKPRTKKPRIRERSTTFKKQRDDIAKEIKK